MGWARRHVSRLTQDGPPATWLNEESAGAKRIMHAAPCASAHQAARTQSPGMLAILIASSAALVLPPLPLDLRDKAALRETHFVSEHANWLIPGRVMQGRHPRSGRGSAFDRIRNVRAEGCDTFVCLQAEVPPQEGSMVLGGSIVETLPGLEPYAADALAAKPEAPPAFAHFGIEDMKPAADTVALRTLIYALAERVRAGEVLYVHCWGGKGRAGLVCACLIANLYEIGAEEALARVQAYCSLRNEGVGATLRSPETEEQKQQVRDFIRLSRASDCVEE